MILPSIFEGLYKIHKNLPLRFALIPYDTERYVDIAERLGQQKNRKPKIFSKYTTLRIWNDLLKRHYNRGYAVIPRHLVSLGHGNSFLSKQNTYIKSQDDQPAGPLLYIMKSSSRDDYHRELLDILALPRDLSTQFSTIVSGFKLIF